MAHTLYRRAHFNAAHRLYRPDWSDEKNREVFGKCSNPRYHGHNYELVVGLKGAVDPETGMVMDIAELKEIIKEQVLDPFDHKNLNEEVPEFAKLNPTVEQIAQVIWQRMRPKIGDQLGLEITLYETPRNFVTYDGP